jgi:MFS family permease
MSAPPVVRGTPEAATSAYAWYIVGLLGILYAVSFIDRFMLTLTIDPISRELGIGDAQMGLLLGAGFAVMYALGGIPIAHMLDRRERRVILAVGVMLWSSSTLASSFARTFGMLAACRAGVALGEAVLTPAAVSIIADLFPPKKRALPVSLYSAVSSVMVTGALIVDGAALQLATAWSPIAGEAPWRIALLLVAAPGLVLSAVIWLTMREPIRAESGKTESPTQGAEAGFQNFVRYLRCQWRFYVPYYIGTGLFAMYGLAIVTWVPTLMVRRYGIEPAMTGYLLGVVGAPTALLGTFFWPWLAARLERRGRRDGIMLAYLISTMVATPALVAAPLASSAWLMLVGLGVVIPCLATAGVLTPLVVQSYGPNRMRARLMALTLLFINLVGFTVGPQFVAFVAGHWPHDSNALAYGLASLGLVCGPLSAIAIGIARRAVKDSLLLTEPE